MLQRVDAMEAELNALVESLRTGAARLNADLELLKGNMGELPGATPPVRRGAGVDARGGRRGRAGLDDRPPPLRRPSKRGRRAGRRTAGVDTEPAAEEPAAEAPAEPPRLAEPAAEPLRRPSRRGRRSRPPRRRRGRSATPAQPAEAAPEQQRVDAGAGRRAAGRASSWGNTAAVADAAAAVPEPAPAPRRRRSGATRPRSRPRRRASPSTSHEVPAPEVDPTPPRRGVPGADVEGARLIALNMALNGQSREETDRYLADNFDLADRASLLDEVYSTLDS